MMNLCILFLITAQRGVVTHHAEWYRCSGQCRSGGVNACMLLLFAYVCINIALSVQTVNHLAPLLALYSVFNGSSSILAGALK